MLEVVAASPIVASVVVHITALLSSVLLFHSNWPLWGQTAGTSVAKEGYRQGCLKANFRAHIFWISK